jgi:ppGpp synthetase/RelA/SpoT-type nucleotidyltranferase/phenylpyruvate tautomerase PptA (4-oxalocrotonate tautomerase family)
MHLTINEFYKRYPLIKPKSQFYNKVRFKGNNTLIRLENLNDEELEKLRINGVINRIKKEFFKFYHASLPEFRNRFFYYYSKNPDLTLLAYAVFLIELSDYDINCFYFVKEEIDSLRGLAKVFGMHRVSRYFTNKIFLGTPDGLEYELNGYHLTIKPHIRALISITKDITELLQRRTGYKFAFYEARLKAPLDIDEKLREFGLDSSNIFDLHDLLGLRLIFFEEQERKEQIEALKEQFLELIEKQTFIYENAQYMISLNPNPLTSSSKGSIKDYHLNPKPNGYNRLHLLTLFHCSSLLIPLEIQVDTHENYGKTENNVGSIHGVQKYLMEEIKTVKAGRIEINISLKINKGHRIQSIKYTLGPFKTDRDIINCLNYFLEQNLNQEMKKAVIERISKLLNYIISKDKVNIVIDVDQNKVNVYIKE